MIRFTARLVGFHLLLVTYLVLLFINHILGKLRLVPSLPIAIRFTKIFAKMVLFTFNIKVTAKLSPTDPPALYLSNHLSYLDAIAIFSQIDAVFITSTEIRDTVGLGHICKMANCIFVNRRSIWGLKSEVQTVSSALKAGYNVVLFPEGTTTSGHKIGNFKSSLVEGAVIAHRPVVPVTINYTAFNGREPLLEDRDYYCWYGTMNFIPHIVRLCTIDSMGIELTTSQPLYPFGWSGDRKKMTKHTKKIIEREYLPVAITS